MISEDYIFLLKHCPRIDFIHCLTQEWNGKPPIMSLGDTILSLIGTEHEIHGIHLLEDITKKGKGKYSLTVSSGNVATLEIGQAKKLLLL